MNEFENAEVAMSLIAYSGEARTHAFEALKCARKNDFVQAKELMEVQKRVHSKLIKLKLPYW